MATDTVLFYTPGTCSLAGLVALEWLGEPYRLCRVEKEARGTPPYLRINPRGQVPTLSVDGRRLFETNAILAHLADRRAGAPGKLLPGNGTWDRDVANQWLAYLGSGFHPPFWPYFMPARYVNDEAVYPAVRDAALISIRRELALVDNHLATREFVLGDRISALDPYLHAMDRWANKLVSMAADYPNVWRHQKALSKNEAVRFGLEIERGGAAADASVAGAGAGGFMGHVALADLADVSP